METKKMEKERIVEQIANEDRDQYMRQRRPERY